MTIFFADLIPLKRLAEIVARETGQHVRALHHYRALQDVYRDRPWVAEIMRFAIGYQQHILKWLEDLPIARSQSAEDALSAYREETSA